MCRLRVPTSTRGRRPPHRILLLLLHVIPHRHTRVVSSNGSICMFFLSCVCGGGGLRAYYPFAHTSIHKNNAAVPRPRRLLSLYRVRPAPILFRRSHSTSSLLYRSRGRSLTLSTSLWTTIFMYTTGDRPIIHSCFSSPPPP